MILIVSRFKLSKKYVGKKRVIQKLYNKHIFLGKLLQDNIFC